MPSPLTCHPIEMQAAGLPASPGTAPRSPLDLVKPSSTALLDRSKTSAPPYRQRGRRTL